MDRVLSMDILSRISENKFTPADIIFDIKDYIIYDEDENIMSIFTN